MNAFYTIITVFIGSATGTAIVQWLLSEYTRKIEHRINFLNKQIEELYGPLYILVSENETLCQMSNDVCNFCRRTGENYSDYTIEGVELSNKYINNVTDRNNKIMQIIENKSTFMDPDNVKEFMSFFKDYSRIIIERDENGKITTPVPVQNKIGSPSFFPKEFSENIKNIYLYKKKEIENLLKFSLINYIQNCFCKLKYLLSLKKVKEKRSSTLSKS